MNLIRIIDFIKQIISKQRTALRFHVCLVCFVIALGGVIIAVVHILAGSVIPENLKWLLTMGGTFIASIGSIPTKDIFSRRDRIATLGFLKEEFEIVQANPKQPDTDYLNQLVQRFWQLVDKLLGG